MLLKLQITAFSPQTIQRSIVNVKKSIPKSDLSIVAVVYGSCPDSLPFNEYRKQQMLVRLIKTLFHDLWK